MSNTELIPLFKVYMNENIEEYIIPTLKSGMITQGKKVEEFEEQLKKWFDYPYILTLNSATSGLTLAYRLLDLNPEYDDIISTPMTCFATNASILANNLDIVWADTDPKTCNIDLEDVKRKISHRTTVLSFVHWGGTPVDLDKVEEIKQYAKNSLDIDLKVVEDCAHAFGAEFNGRKLGTHGNICVFSLQAIKHCTTGDGGLIFLPNEEMYNRAKILRWYGIDRDRRSLPGSDFRLEPDIPEYGYKFHMNDVNASIGLGNFINIDERLEKHRQNAEFYHKNLSQLQGLDLFQKRMNIKSVYWIFTMKIKNNRKNEFINYMKENNIVVSQVHARNDKHSCLSKYKTELPKLDLLEKQVVSIPVGWWVTENQCEYVVEKIKEFFKDEIIPKFELLAETDLKQYQDLMTQLIHYQEPTICNDIFLKRNIFVCKLNDKIVSTAKLLIEPKIYRNMGHIEDVITHSTYRGKGYSSKLLQYIKQVAFSEYNCYKIVLNCKPELEEFYTKCGFEQTGLSFSSYNI